MKEFSFILLSAFIFYFNLHDSLGKICVAEELKISNLSGIAIFSNGKILKDLPILLSKDLRGEKIIKTVGTDENGKFTFGEVNSGKYYVIIQNVKYLESLTFSVKVKKKYGRKQAVGIKITMYSDNPGNCSLAETIMLKDV